MNVPRFSLGDIVTLETWFRRDDTLPAVYDENTASINIQRSMSREENECRVHLTTEYKQTINEQTFVEGRVVMVGHFKITGDMSDETIQLFCDINAPAILFPFVREAFATASVKSGLRPLLLQPVNFVEMAKQPRQEHQALPQLGE